MDWKGICLAVVGLTAPALGTWAEVPVYADDVDHSSYLVTVTLGDGEMARSAVGIVVDEKGRIITSSALIGRDSDQTWSVSKTGNAANVPAAVLSIDRELGVALLEPEGSPFSAHATFAREDVSTQSPIRSIAIDGAGNLIASEGVIINTSMPPIKQPPVNYLLHSAPIASLGFGGAVVNRCGDLVGINVVSPLLSQNRARRLDVPDGDIYALDREPLLEFLIGNNIVTDINADRCLTHDDAVKNAVEEQAKSEAEAKKSADELEDAQQRLEELETEKQAAEDAALEAKREAERRRLEADRLKGDADATKEERDEADKAAEEAERLAAEASINISDYSKRIDKLTDMIERLEGEIAEGRKQLRYAIGGGVLAVLLIGALLSFWLLRRGAKLKSTAGNLAEAQQELRRTFPDVECRGEDAQKVPHAFRISGSALLRSPGGLVIGRQPATASIVLNHPEVSREHARVILRGGEVLIEDLDTTNGTKINGEVLISGKPVRLSDSDTLSIGSINFTVRFLDV